MIKVPSLRVMRLRGGRVELREQPQAIENTLKEEYQRIKENRR